MPRWTEAEITDLVRTKRATTLPTVDGQTPAERWPELRQFIGPYLHQDFAMDGTAEQCVALAIDGHPAAADRKAVLAELRELQARDGLAIRRLQWGCAGRCGRGLQLRRLRPAQDLRVPRGDGLAHQLDGVRL